MLKLKAHVVVGMLILTIATQNLFGLTVTSNLDPGTPGSGTATCVGTATGSGLTLREAIEIINLGGTDRTIEFDLPAGKETIFICSLLPIITPDDVIVDGSNTAGSGVQVTIDGTNISNVADLWGIRYIGSSRSITRNITITNISTSGGPGNNNIVGLQLNSSPDHIVENVTVSNLSTTGNNGDISGIGINGTRTVVYGATIFNLMTTGAGGSDVNAIRVDTSALVVLGGPGSQGITIADLTAEQAFARGVSFFNSDNATVENVTITNLTTMPSGVSTIGVFGDANTQGTDVDGCTIEDFTAARDAVGIQFFGRCDFVSNNNIRNLRSINQTSGATTGNVVGIDLTASNATQSILEGCFNNTIENLTSGGHTSNSTGFVQGIFCDREFNGGCNNNLIRHLTSGTSDTSTSGAVTGVRIDESIIPNGTNTGFDNNIIQHLTSGDASDASGNVLGIDVGIDVEMSLNSNEISHLTSGTSTTDNSGAVTGIQVAGSTTSDTLSNKICSLTSGDALGGTSGDVMGVGVSGSIALDFNENEIYSLRSSGAEITGNVTGLATEQARNCSENIITGLESGDASTGASGTIYGINIGALGVGSAQILQNCNQNKIGINLSTIGTECFCPEFPFGSGSDIGTELICEGSDFRSSGLISGTSATSSGNVTGIRVGDSVGGQSNENCIRTIISGDSSSNSGIAIGIDIESIGSGTGDDGCSANTIHAVQSGSSLTSDSGDAYGIKSSNITGPCNHNWITTIFSGVASASNSGNVFGISVDVTLNGNASNNTIGVADEPILGSQFGSDIFSGCFDGSAGSEMCSLGLKSGMASGLSGEVTGIKASTTSGNVNNNKIECVLSGDSTTSLSGLAVAIDAVQIGGSCNENCIKLIHSGNAVGSTSFAMAIAAGAIGSGSETNDCNANIIHDIKSGDSLTANTGNSFGILTGSVGGSCAHNWITSIKSGLAPSGQSGDTSAIDVTGTIGGNCSNNAIGIGSPILGSDFGSELFFECFNGIAGTSFCNLGIISGDSSDDSGDAKGINAAFITADANSNAIQCVISGDSETARSGEAIGLESIQIMGNCSVNMVATIISGLALLDCSGDVTGINAQLSVGQDCNDNNISQLTSGESRYTSGNVDGILLGSNNGTGAALVAQNCSNNSISDLTSGESCLEVSGAVSGIAANNEIEQNCNNNTINDLISSTAPKTGDVTGIIVPTINGDNSGNQIYSLVSGDTVVGSCITGSGTGMDGSGTGMDGSGTGMDGSGTGMDGSGTGMDGSGTGMDGSGTGMDGSGTGMNGSGTGMMFMLFKNCGTHTIAVPTDSGNVTGIDTKQVGGDTNQNCIKSLLSGEAEVNSGSTIGIDAGNIDTDCSGNTIHEVISGDAITGTSGESFGIEADSIGGGVNGNWITTIASGAAPVSTSGIATAIQVSGTVGDSCSSNAIGVGTPTVGSEFGTGPYLNCFDGIAGTELCALGIQSGDAGDNSGVAKGIKADVVTTNANNNNIRCLISGDSDTANSGEVTGIDSDQIMGSCNANTIAILISGLALLDSSGVVDGINVDLSVGQDCNDNTVSELTSGESENASGGVHGISLGEGNGTNAVTAVQNCSNNNISELTSGESNSDVSGEVTGILVNNNTAQNCSSNTINNLTSGEALTNMSGDVAGIEVTNSIGGNSSDNTITNLTSSIALETGNVTGIDTITIGESSSNNTMTSLVSGNTVVGTEIPGTGTELPPTPTTSGDVTGIDVEQSVGQDCNSNIMSTLTSGDAETESGRVHGISLGGEVGSGGVAVQNCNNNQLTALSSGPSNTSSSGEVTGIFANNEVAQNCVGNQIETLTSGEALTDVSGEVTGIDILAEVGGNCSSNSVIELVSSTALATGDVTGIETDRVGNNCSSNTITSLTSGNTIAAGTEIPGSGTGIIPMPTTSGDVLGIEINESVGQDCNSNNVTILTSGDAETDSGRVFGITLGDDNGSSDVTAVQSCNSNTVNTLTSGEANTDDSGDVTGIFINNDVAQDCSSNTINDLISGVAPDTSGKVNGIDVVDTIGGECTDNTVNNLTNSPADTTLDTTGIEVNTVGGFLARNMISNVTSEPGTTTSGNVFGINVENQAQGATFSNMVTNLTASGTTAVGININELQADALNNTVIDVTLLEAGTNGSAILPAEAAGILISDMSNDTQATCNDTEQIQSVRDGNASGVWIKNANSILVSNNTSRDITGLNAAAAHGIRLGNKDTNEKVQSSLGEENLIRNIDGGANNGFGITIENNQSTQNKLFGNSISEIETLAINYENPPFDGLLNIDNITCLQDDMLRVQGSLIPLVAPIGEYRIELFASPNNTPPESYQLIGSFNHTPAPPAFDVTVALLRPLLASEFVTATATALTTNNKNTTPVSDPLDGCNSVGGGTDIDPICEFISVCDPNCTAVNPGPPPSTSCPVPVPTS